MSFLFGSKKKKNNERSSLLSEEERKKIAKIDNENNKNKEKLQTLIEEFDKLISKTIRFATHKQGDGEEILAWIRRGMKGIPSADTENHVSQITAKYKEILKLNPSHDQRQNLENQINKCKNKINQSKYFSEDDATKLVGQLPSIELKEVDQSHHRSVGVGVGADAGAGAGANALRYGGKGAGKG